MVNASDSAALAYGISCILHGNNDGTAEADATSTAVSNVSDASLTSRQFACSSGKVKVTYAGNQARLFLPVLGKSATGTVSATASASWGGAGGSVTPPMEVSLNKLRIDCPNFNIPNPPPPGPEPQCTLLFPPQGNGDWGGVNTTNVPTDPAVCNASAQSSKLGWNVCGPPNGSIDVRPSCNGMSAQDAMNAMNGNTLVTLNPSGTTWACADNGQTNSVWAKFNDVNHAGKVFCFPATDDTKVYPPTGAPKAFDVTSFIPLRVIQYFKQGNNLFLTVSWPGPQPCGTQGGGPPTGGAYQIGLNG
jgi:hypothetical protein